MQVTSPVPIDLTDDEQEQKQEQENETWYTLVRRVNDAPTISMFHLGRNVQCSPISGEEKAFKSQNLPKIRFFPGVYYVLEGGNRWVPKTITGSQQMFFYDTGDHAVNLDTLNQLVGEGLDNKLHQLQYPDGVPAGQQEAPQAQEEEQMQEEEPQAQEGEPNWNDMLGLGQVRTLEVR